MKVPSKYYYKTFFYGEDFIETLKEFDALINRDKRIIEKIPTNKINVIRKNGMMSYGIRFLIENYVKINKEKILVKNVQPNN